jgi:hypothetical protein
MESKEEQRLAALKSLLAAAFDMPLRPSSYSIGSASPLYVRLSSANDAVYTINLAQGERQGDAMLPTHKVYDSPFPCCLYYRGPFLAAAEKHDDVAECWFLRLFTSSEEGRYVTGHFDTTGYVVTVHGVIPPE